MFREFRTVKVKTWARDQTKKAFSLLPTVAQYQLIGRWRTPPTHEFLSSSDQKALRHHVRHSLLDPLRNKQEPSVWFLPTHGWASSAFQRPQQLARAFAEIGCSVLYFEQWFPNRGLALPSTVSPKGRLREIEPGLHVVRCPDQLVASLINDCSPDALMMFWPEQALALPSNSISRSQNKLTCTKVVYEVIDDSSLLPNADSAWHAAHRHCLLEADIVTASADDLLSQVKHIRADVLLIPNGVRIEDWRSTSPPRSGSVPIDMAEPRQASVVVGYYGAIAPWFDWFLWEAAARLRPEWAFVLIGYPYDGNEAEVRERVQKLPNCYYLGKKPYHELSRYLDCFDVATIPFVLNSITHACSPVKLFEYFAAGKFVVSTPMREIMKYSGVGHAESPPDFVLQIEAALAKQRDTENLAILMWEAERNTWKSRAQMLVDAIKQSHGIGASRCQNTNKA
jgi:glycosyltransferase involved in cell wall biosynthesis